jgi:mRNA interferase MazF
MAGFVKGDVVVIPFPFSDLSQSKRRPALVLAEADAQAVILCQITAPIASPPQTEGSSFTSRDI